jgi:hypothetical protein
VTTPPTAQPDKIEELMAVLRQSLLMIDAHLVRQPDKEERERVLHRGVQLAVTWIEEEFHFKRRKRNR